MTRSVRAPRSRAAVLAAVLATALLAACSGSDGGPTPPPGPTDRPDLVANGAVYAIAVAPDGTAYLGGDFTAIGPYTGHLVVLDPVSGALAAPARGFAGNGRYTGLVSAAAPDGRGGWYVAGQFTTEPGAAEVSLARVRADGSVDPAFATSFDGSVDALAVSAGVVYVGGGFDHVAGTTRRRLAAVDAETGALAGWDPLQDPSVIPGLLAPPYPGFVNALALRDGTVYAAGVSHPWGRWGSWVAAIDPAGVVSAWHPAIDGYGVQALAVRGGTLYAGGQFTTVDGQPRTGLAAFDPSGALSTWSVAAANVRALAVADGTLYAGGAFLEVNGRGHRGIVAFDPSGAVSSWDPDLDGRVSALAASGGTLYVGGEFESVGPVRRPNLAAFDRTGALLPWDPRANGEVHALAVANGRVLAGGSFTSVGAVRRGGLAALDPGGRLIAWDPDGPATVTRRPMGDQARGPTVRAVALAGDRVVVGGEFQRLGGLPRSNLAVVDLRGGLLPGTPAVNGPVHALASRAGAIHAGGVFSVVGGVPRASLVAFDPADGRVRPFDPALVGTGLEQPAIHALATQGTTLYVGGRFTAAAGARRGHGAAFDAAGALLPWDPGASGADATANPIAIHALAPSTRGVYVAGTFSTLGGAARRGVGRVDPATGAVASWDPMSGAWTGTAAAYALLPAGETVHVGGMFTLVGAAPRYSLAAFDAGTGAVTTWDPGPFGFVYALGATRDRILVGEPFGFTAVAP